MTTEECAICGDSVPFDTTTHLLLNPTHVDGVADHYVCRPCYDEHLAGLFDAPDSAPSAGPDGASGGARIDSDPPPTAEK